MRAQALSRRSQLSLLKNLSHVYALFLIIQERFSLENSSVSSKLKSAQFSHSLIRYGSRERSGDIPPRYNLQRDDSSTIPINAVGENSEKTEEIDVTAPTGVPELDCFENPRLIQFY